MGLGSGSASAGGGDDSDGGRRSSASEGDMVQQRPLLERAISGRAAAGPHRQVHARAMEEAGQIAEHSPLLLFLHLFFCTVELVLALVCLSKGWDRGCDRPLRTWIVVYTARLALLMPLKVARYRNRHQVHDPANPSLEARLHSWLQLFAFCWMVVGQYW